jgi:hypothetical protein
VQMHRALIDRLGDGHGTLAQCVRDDELLEWTDDKRPREGSASGRIGKKGRLSKKRRDLFRLKERLREQAFSDLRWPDSVVTISPATQALGAAADIEACRRLSIGSLRGGARSVRLVDASSQAAFAVVQRRKLSNAEKINFKAPDFEGLDIYLSYSFDTDGGITTQAFDNHISDLQKSEAQIMKHPRLFKEEADARKKDKNKKDGQQGAG